MNQFSYKRLYKKILQDATVNIHGIHGPSHWVRVMRNGIYIAEKESFSHKVIKCFALIHDSQRLNDDEDPLHGPRAAEYAKGINDSYLFMTDFELEQLVYACTYHTNEKYRDDEIVHACWDADRLDLDRIGITPNPAYLKTNTAIDIAKNETFHLLADFKPKKDLLNKL